MADHAAWMFRGKRDLSSTSMSDDIYEVGKPRDTLGMPQAIGTGRGCADTGLSARRPPSARAS